MKHKYSGFTLIELMIAVIIIGILAAIAIPAYQNYVMESRRADAKAGLTSLQLAQEKYRTNCVRYAGGIANTMSCVTGTFNLIGSTVSPDGYYTLAISSAGTNTYVLRATPATLSPQLKDTACPSFTLNQDGQHAGVDGDISTTGDNDPGVTTTNPRGTCW